MSEWQEDMMQALFEKPETELRKELLDFTVHALRAEGVLSDESLNQWSKVNIDNTSVFDGVDDIYSWWQYGLQWEYVQIPMKRDVIKIIAHRI